VKIISELTIRRKLVVIFTVTCLTIMILAGVSMVTWSQYMFRQNMIRDLVVQTQMAADNCRAAMAFGDSQTAVRLLESFRSKPSVISVTLDTRAAENFARYCRVVSEDSKHNHLDQNGWQLTSEYIIVQEGVILDGEILGRIILYSDLAPLASNLRWNTVIVIGVFVFASLVGYLLLSRLQRLISEPILSLTDVARQVSLRKDYSVRAVKYYNDEVGVLIEAFNQMLIQIQKEMTDRQRAEEELRKHRDHLEEVVSERTGELKLANQRMQISTERANLLAKQAVQANKSKSEFLANMSHEIRTPMNAILGFGELLCEENLLPEQKKYVDIILSSGKSLLRIINDILDFSKIEAGKLKTEIVDCALVQMLDEIESLFRPMCRQKNLDFNVLYCSEIPQMIRTDPIRLRQCLVNLLGNAIKFTDTGHVYLNVGLETLDKMPYIRFDVEDTGIGIPADKQHLIFEPFTQADGSHTRKFGGTGLGLTITRQIVELLHGRILVRSEIGRGSVFSVELPVGIDINQQSTMNHYEALEQLQKDQSETTQNPSGRCVLVAEDAKANQTLIQILLQKMGFQVTIVEDGQQAVEQVRNKTFDIILMDMQMPVMNGYEATREIKTMGIRTPVIAVTAHAMKGDEQKCLDAGCDGYIAKPIDRKKIEQIIREHLIKKPVSVPQGASS
jgi:signal transduction histidine kinase/CheY-like chemotaxis protein